MDANHTIFDLADKLKLLQDEKDILEETLKSLNARIADTEFQLSDQMAQSETQNFTRAGTMFYLATKTRASAAAGVKAHLFAALKANGYADLVTETVNANSLSSFVREQIEENSDTLPGWLEGLVNVFEQTTVGTRKAKK